jgi:signal peptidase complex subunit 1
MADQLLEQAREAFEGQIDFKGQELAEYLATALLATVGVCSFSTGAILIM